MLLSARDSLRQDGISGGTGRATTGCQIGACRRGEGCVRPPGPRRGPSVRSGKHPVPPCLKVRPWAPGAPGRLPAPQEAPCKSLVFLSLGAPARGRKTAVEFRRESRGSGLGRRSGGGYKPAPKPEVPTGGVFPELAPSQRGQVAVRHPDPHLLCGDSCRRSPCTTETLGARIPGPWEEVSDRALMIPVFQGREEAPHSKKEVWGAVAPSRSDLQPLRWEILPYFTDNVAQKSRHWLDLNLDFFFSMPLKRQYDNRKKRKSSKVLSIIHKCNFSNANN